jgi:hypothetical protein
MTLNLGLSMEEEARLRALAEQAGVPPESYLTDVVRSLLNEPQIDRRLATLRTLLDDEAEQRETGEFLLKALDEDRSSARKLFP